MRVLGYEITQKANLSGAHLSGANLFRANLSGADLSEADLYGANLYGANLYGANLYGANLSGADLSGAHLSGADLSGANLSRADLSRADLSGANLSRANLSGADLYGAKDGNSIITDIEKGPHRDRDYQFILFIYKNNKPHIKAGCRNFTIGNYKEHTKTYDSKIKALKTMAIIEYFEKILEIRECN